MAGKKKKSTKAAAATKDAPAKVAKKKAPAKKKKATKASAEKQARSAKRNKRGNGYKDPRGYIHIGFKLDTKTMKVLSAKAKELAEGNMSRLIRHAITTCKTKAPV